MTTKERNLFNELMKAEAAADSMTTKERNLFNELMKAEAVAQAVALEYLTYKSWYK